MKLYIQYFLIHLESIMQYKISFLLTVLGQFLISFSFVLTIYFMFLEFSSIEGFTYEEVLLCFALVQLSFSIAESVCRGFDCFSELISNGEFDRILTRPKSVLFQIIAARVEFNRVGRIIQAVIILIYAVLHIDILWTFDKVLVVHLMVLGGILIFGSMFVLGATITFFTIADVGVVDLINVGGRDFGRYPYGIYGKKVLLFFTFVIPFALIQYYPLLYVLGEKTDMIYALAPILSLLFLIPVYLFWKFGFRHYKSTGS